MKNILGDSQDIKNMSDEELINWMNIPNQYLSPKVWARVSQMSLEQMKRLSVLTKDKSLFSKSKSNKQCSCGSKHTSRPNFHLRYCDLSE